MPFIQVEVDGKVVSQRESDFGDAEQASKVADTLNGRNLRALKTVTVKKSRRR